LITALASRFPFSQKKDHMAEAIKDGEEVCTILIENSQ